MELNDRIEHILRLLIKQGGVPVRVPFLAEKTGVSERTIRNDLELIDDELSSYEGLHLVRKPGTGIWIEGDIETFDRTRHKNEADRAERFHSQRERVDWIIFKLVTLDCPILLKEIEATLRISHSSIQRDVELVEERLESVGLTLERKRSEGLWVTGDEWTIRKTLFEILESLVGPMDLNELTQVQLPGIYQYSIPDFKAFSHAIPNMVTVLNTSKLQLTHKSTKNIIVHLLIVWIRRGEDGRLSMDDTDRVPLSDSNEDFKALAGELFSILRQTDPKIGREEMDYVILHLLSSRYTARDADTPFNLKEEEVVARMIMVAGSFMGIDFTRDRLLRQGLLNHIHSMRYRIEYGIPVERPEPVYIEELYPGIKAATLASIQVAETFFKIEIPEDETIFLALYFGAAIERREPKVHFRDLRTLIICETGLGTSQILQERLTRFLPNLKIVRIANRHDALQGGDETIDFFITTVPIKKERTDKPVISVNAIPDYTDILTIQSLMTDILSEQEASTSNYSGDIIAIARKHGLDNKAFNREITQYLEKTGIQAQKKNLSEAPAKSGLLGLLPENRIAFTGDPLDWRQATHTAAGLLETGGCVRAKYKDAIIDTILENGPYMVIAPHVALLHAKPEAGAMRPGMALLVSREGVTFNKRAFDPVHLIFAFSATDDHSHLRALSELLSLISEPRTVEAMKSLDGPAALRQHLASNIKTDKRGDPK